MNEQVILVNERDEPVGVMEKLQAHLSGGTLHRAFSIFVFDAAGRLLLQRRAAGKYHFAGRWSNTCCSHPRPGENLHDAARRRLREEFGFETPLAARASLIYRADDAATGLTEHEFLHVLVGRYDGPVAPSAAEIAEWAWMVPADLRERLTREPEAFSPWLPMALAALEPDVR